MKKFGKRLLYVILALAVIHGIATFIMGRKIAARLQAYRDNGEIVSVNEMNGPKVPDAENGAILYQKAFSMVPSLKKDDGRVIDDLLNAAERNKRPELWGQADAVVSKYAAVFPVLEKASAMPKCRFSVNWESAFETQGTDLWPPYAKMRSHARLLCADALIQAKNGNADGAAHSLALAFRMSESLRDAPTLIGLLVRIAIDRMTTRTLQDVCLLTSLSVTGTRELDGILAAVDMSRSLERGMQGERAFGIRFFYQMEGNMFTLGGDTSSANSTVGRVLVWLVSWIGRPFIYANEGLYLDHMDRLIANGRKPYREGISFLKTEPRLPGYAVLAAIVTPVFARASAAVDSAKASISGSRLFLALLTCKKQFGAYPSTLAQLHSLEPQIDPFSGKGFVYKTQGNGFLLYSIGENLKDDGARPWIRKAGSKPAPGGYSYTNARGQKSADIVWEMNR